MKKNSLKKNYIYNLIYQIFLLIVPIFVTPYVARVLGSDGSGEYAFSFSIVSYFTIVATLGFNIYGQRAIAKVQNDSFKQSLTFWEIVIARIIPTVITLTLYYCLAYFDIYGALYRDLILILGIEIFAVIFDISFFFQGREDFGKIALINVFIKTLSIISIFVFVKNKSDLWVYTFIQALTILISNLALWFFASKCLVKIRFRDLDIKKHFLPSLILFIPTIATTLYTSLDKTMIGVITNDTTEIGNYDYADKIVKIGLTVISSLGTIMVSRNSTLFENKNYEGLKFNVNRTIQFVFAIGIPIMLGFIAIADNFIPWYLGEGYEKAAILMKILSPIVLIIGLSNILGLQFLVPTNQDKKYTISIFAGVIINFALNFIFIYFFKSIGAAIATLCAEFCVTCAMGIFCRKIIDFKLILKKIWKYALAGLLMFSCCYVESVFLEASVLNTFIICFTGVIVYFFILLLLKEEFLYFYGGNIIKFIKTRFFKKSNK